MNLPNKRSGHGQKIGMKQGKRARLEIVVILLLAFVVSIFVAFHQTNQLIEHHDNRKEQKVLHQDAPVRYVGTEPLAHEELFMKTLTSCLPQENNPNPNKKCKEFIPEDSVQRVALLAPPGDMSHVFFRLIQVVLGRAKKKKKIDIEVIPTTHIAPYGYGKTHGWTKIIRVVPTPMLLGVTNTLQFALVPGQGIHEITLSDIKANLRQQIRYHCRLSHVAAHTALWTLTLEDVVNGSLVDLIDQIQVFLGLERDNFMEELDENDNDVATDDLVPPKDMELMLYALYAYGASILTNVQSMVMEDIMKVMDDVLTEELSISKNLTAWPCQSFWTVGDTSNRLKLSPIIARVAKAVSPNCTAPFTSCFVKRDQCEGRGDGQCS